MNVYQWVEEAEKCIMSWYT